MKHSPVIFAGPDDSNALGNTISARRGKCIDEKNTLESKEKKVGGGGAVMEMMRRRQVVYSCNPFY